MIACYACGCPYKPEPHRWRCPECGAKDHCCEGEPAPPHRPPWAD